LAKVAFTSREHIIAIEAREKGLVGVTLRYPYEVRKLEDYFDDIENEKVPKDMLELATHIVETKSGHFDPKKFKDTYEDALKDLIKQKQSGTPIERTKPAESTNVISLMDALRKSVQGHEDGSSKASKRTPAQPRATKKVARTSARHKKAS
jgi:Ku protein